MGGDAAAGGPARVRGVHHAHDRPRLHRGQARHQVWPVSSVLSLYLYLHRSIHLFTILPQTCRREAHVYFHTGEKTMTSIDNYLECTRIL